MGHGLKHAWGVPFVVVDPDANNGCAVLALYGREVPDRPKQASVLVDDAFERIFFLHGSMYAHPGALIATYRIVFEDGGDSSLEVRVGRNVADWYGEKPKPPLTGNAVPAWYDRLYGEGGARIRTFMAWWDNPRPGTRIRAVEVNAGTGEAPGYPVLMAVTGRRKTYRMAGEKGDGALLRDLDRVEAELGRLQRRMLEVNLRNTPEDRARAADTVLLDIPALMALYRRKVRALFPPAVGTSGESVST
jgi:hypothetical protein